MADLETLTLQINTESQQAYSAIGKLAQRLDALSISIAKLETGKLNQLASGLENLNMVIQNMNATSSKWDYSRIVSNLGVLATTNTAGLDSLSASLTTLMGALSNIGSLAPVTDSVKALVMAIGKLGSKSVTTAIVNIPQLEKALAHLITTFSKLPNINQSVIDFTNSLSNLASQGSRIGTATTSINNSLERFSSSATRATRKSFNLASAVGKVYAEFWIAMRAASGLKKAFTDAADYLEAYNYFDVVAEKIGTDTFHKAGVGSADEYAEAFTSEMKRKMKQMSGLELDLEDRLIKTTNAKNLGLNLTDITQYQASIASITNAMGQAQEVSTATAKAFSMLAADMGSLRNVDYEQVAANLQSALTGQARALYKYGIDLTAATLEQYAYANGVEKAVSEMTQAEKAQLRLLAILDQSKVAWGDLANTINSPANQLRMLKNNFAELGTVLGQLFIPVMQNVLPWINGLSIALKNLLVDIAQLLGIQLNLDEFGKGFSDTMEDDTEAVDDLNKAMKETKKGIREFDELKVIGGDNSKAASGLADQIDLTEQIVAATAEYERVWDQAYEQMQSKAQAIAEKLGMALEPIKKIVEDFHVGNFFQAGQDISDLVISIFNFFRDAIDAVDWDALGTKIGEFFEGIKWKEILGSIASLVWSAIQAAFDAWTGSFSVAPFETALITAFGLLKFTGLGSKVTDTLAKKIATTLKKKGITQASLAKAGLGAISIGLGLSMTIDNIKDIKASSYASFSFESLAKSAISSLLVGAGFSAVTSAVGLALGPLGFAVSSGIALAINLIAADLAKPDEDLEEKLARQEYEWVEESHLNTVDVIANINLKEGEIDAQYFQIDDLANKVYELSLDYDKLTDGEKNLLKYYSEELIKVMPELANQIDTVTGAYKGTREELDKLIESQKRQIKTSAIKEVLSGLTERQYELKPELEKVTQSFTAAQKEYYDYKNQLLSIGFNEKGIEAMENGATLEEAVYEQTKYSENFAEEYNKLFDAIQDISPKNIRQLKADLKVSQEAMNTLEKDYYDLEQKVWYYTDELESAVSENMTAATKDLSDAEAETYKVISSQKLPNAVKGTMSNIDKKIQNGHTVTKRDMNDMFNDVNNSFAGLEDGKVPEEVQGTMDAIKQAIIDNSPDLINLMAQLRLQMESAFENATLAGNGEILWNPNGVVTKIDEAFYTLESGVANHARMTKNDIKGLTESLAELFNDKLPESIKKSLNNLGDVIENGGNILGAIDDLKTDIIKEAQGIGLNVDLGVAGGVYSGTDVVKQSVSYMEKNGIEVPLKTETQIASPSKKYRDLAEYIPEGVALGIEEDTPEVVSAMDDMVRKMQLAFTDYRLNIPSLDLGSNNRNTYGNTTQYGSNNNALYEQMLNSGNLNNAPTEVVFRVEGDPYGIFKVVLDQNESYRRRTHRSAFT